MGSDPMVNPDKSKGKTMNMKRMMMIAALTAILGGTGFVPPAEAAVTVTNVICQQHYPWNGLVDIDYEIVSDQPDAKYWVYPKGTDNHLGKRVIMNTLSGDGATNCVGVGRHRMVWDAKADMPRFHTPDLQVTLQVIADGAKYLVVDISGGTNAVTYPVTYSSTPPDVTTDTCRTEELWLRLVVPGTFMMGSPVEEKGRSENEQQHQVRLTKPFYIGVFELTQKQWLLISGNTNAIYYAGDCRPVDSVSYDDIRGSALGSMWPKSSVVDNDSFMGVLRRKTALQFDLPTEAQWEYACRAGTTTAWNNGSDGEGMFGYDAGQYGWNENLKLIGRFQRTCSDGRGPYDEHTKVGLYLANGWGLYDMHGNVKEWCRDGYRAVMPDYYEVDPGGEDTRQKRCLRSSDWNDKAPASRSAARSGAASGHKSDGQNTWQNGRLGFRVACFPGE